MDLSNAQRRCSLFDYVQDLIVKPQLNTLPSHLVAVQAYTITLFCSSHHISRSHLHSLDKSGTGPRRMKVGRRVLISVEAATEWRRSMEVAQC